MPLQPRRSRTRLTSAGLGLFLLLGLVARVVLADHADHHRLTVTTAVPPAGTAPAAVHDGATLMTRMVAPSADWQRVTTGLDDVFKSSVSDDYDSYGAAAAWTRGSDTVLVTVRRITSPVQTPAADVQAALAVSSGLVIEQQESLADGAVVGPRRASGTDAGEVAVLASGSYVVEAETDGRGSRAVPLLDEFLRAQLAALR